jgi:Chaperonin 10 Kd subunit
VIAAGPGGRDKSGKLVPLDLQIGDGSLFRKWSGAEITLCGLDLLIMKESGAILDDEILWPGPTLRQKQVGTPGGSACTYST